MKTIHVVVYLNWRDKTLLIDSVWTQEAGAVERRDKLNEQDGDDCWFIESPPFDAAPPDEEEDDEQ